MYLGQASLTDCYINIEMTLNQATNAGGTPAALAERARAGGARLLQVGFAEIRLLARRPPRTTRTAQHVAAGHDELSDMGRPAKVGGSCIDPALTR